MRRYVKGAYVVNVMTRAGVTSHAITRARVDRLGNLRLFRGRREAGVYPPPIDRPGDPGWLNFSIAKGAKA